MALRAAIVLLGLLVAASGCATGDDVRAPDTARRATSRESTTAPAAGLWSHRFVRWPDGSITAVGFSREPAGIALIRYRVTGEIERDSLVVHQEFGAGKLDALAVMRSGADKVYVAACQPPDCWGYLVLGRFQRDGSLDRAFGENGLVRTSVPGGALEPRALALQRDGKIIVAGELSIDSSRQGFLARYLPDGTADTDFGGDGLVLTDVAGLTAVAVQPDGRVVAAGYRLDSATGRAVSSGQIVRHLPDGQVDTRFGVGGIAQAPLSVAKALLLDSRARIVAAGAGGHAGGPALAIARLTSSGSLDRAFGRSGYVLHRRPGDHAARIEAVTLLGDDSLIATGWVVRGGRVLTRRYRLIVVAVRPSGALARSFGKGGRMVLDGVEARGQVAFQPSARRVLAAGPDDDLKPTQIVFATFRLP